MQVNALPQGMDGHAATDLTGRPPPRAGSTGSNVANSPARATFTFLYYSFVLCWNFPSRFYIFFIVVSCRGRMRAVKVGGGVGGDCE